MTADHIWPLVGVLLGWFLSTIVSEWTARRADNRALGRLIARLLAVHAHVRILESAAESFKRNTKTWEDFEQLRRRAIDRHFLEPIDEIDRLHSAIGEISGDYPIESLRLRSLVDGLRALKGLQLSESAKVPEVYIRLLAAFETGIQVIGRELRKSIYRLALKHSPVTLIKAWLFFHRRDQLSGSNQEPMRTFIDETFSIVEAHKDSAKPNNSASSTEDGASAKPL